MSSTASMRRSRSRRSTTGTGFRLGRTLLLILIVLITYKIGRTGLYAWQTYQTGNALLALAMDDPEQISVPRMRAELTRFSAGLTGLDQELRPIAPILRPLASLGTYGATLAALPQFLTTGAELSQLGVEALALLGPEIQNGADLRAVEAILPALAAVGRRTPGLTEHADAAAAALAQVDADKIHPRLANRVAQAQSLLAAMPVGLTLSPYLPDLLGFGAPKTYLILVQNNDELRATGGFLAGIGTLTVADGKPTERNFEDSYKFYSRDVEYPWAPEPMQRYMNVDLMLLRDANWSPDFPTSARTIQAIYAMETGQAIDGIVSIDLRAAELIVNALGPLRMEGVDEPITGSNIAENVKRFWDTPVAIENATADENRGWWQQRKDFMPALVEASLQRLQAGNFDAVGLMQATQQALDERAIQIWMGPSDAGDALSDAGWDGHLQARPGSDFLALVDTNVGYNKVNAVVERTLDYAVEWPQGQDQPALATATITYRHTVPVPDHTCDPEPRYGENYEDMTKRCFFNYVRLYAPAGSELVSTEGVFEDSVTSQRGESNTQLMTGYFVQEPGSEHTVRFTYRLPAEIVRQGYDLTVQRQSGTGPLPFTATMGGSGAYTEELTGGTLHWSP